MPAIDPRTGVLQHTPNKATNGYTLFTPLGQYNTYLIDMRGEVVHQWELPNDVGNYAYLLENGNLLVAIRTEEKGPNLPAKGGHLIEYDWNGNVVWEHIDHMQHHDFKRKSNGNTVYAAWTKQTDASVIKSIPGGIEGTEYEGCIYTDVIREIDATGKVVWEWDVLKDMDMDKFPLDPTVARREYAHANTISTCPNGDVIINWRFNNTMAMVLLKRQFIITSPFGHVEIVFACAYSRRATVGSSGNLSMSISLSTSHSHTTLPVASISRITSV